MRFTSILSMSVGALTSVSAFPTLLDSSYPGTNFDRMNASRDLVRAADLSGDWTSVRKTLLTCAGLHDYPDMSTHPPGAGYTGHSFNDWNHVCVCTMNMDMKGSFPPYGIYVITNTPL